MTNLTVTEGWSYPRKSRSIFQYISYQRIGAFAALTDFALILVASIASGVAYHFLVLEIQGVLTSFVTIGCYSGLIFVLLCRLLGLYRPNALLSVRAQLRGVVASWAGALLFVTSLLFLLKTSADYSRGATLVFGFFGLACILASRAITGRHLRDALASGTLAGHRAIIVGDPEELTEKSALHLLRTYGMREVARFEFPQASDHVQANIAHDAQIVDAAIKAARTNRAAQVLLALRWVDASRRDLICERLRVLPLPVLLLPDRFVSSVLAQSKWERRTPTTIELQRAPLSTLDLVLKRLVDVTLSGVGLLILSPLLLLTAAAIKLDSPGPVIFRQRRRGFNGREFAIYKFRTMRVLEDGHTIRQAQRDDERVTWLGRLLRSSSIDELPQLINVLTGEMSLVGPRPHAVCHDDEYSKSIDKYAFRHHVKPGITGWAQIHGFRGPTDVALMDQRIQHDLWYTNNWSLWLDLQIMLRTCIEVMRQQNAF
jgi:undecaprenyl-phosphate galactose phosphotransferase/putative colanic acid biosynthesis UDP-glucose lipid carrier transferase